MTPPPRDPVFAPATGDEEQLRGPAGQEHFYRAVFEHTGTAMMVIDEDTTIVLANAECERITGYDRAAIEGKKQWPEFVAEEDRARMLALHRARREPGGTAPGTYEFTLVARDGERRRIFLTVSLIPGTKQSVASLIDITSRVRAEEELKKAGGKLLLLSAITRHDILNKLTVLLGYVDLAMQAPAPPPLPDYLAKIHAVADTLEAQVQFTKEYQSLGMDTPHWQGITAITGKVRGGLTPGAVVIDDRSGTLEVYADPLFAKVIYNLLENALRHGGPSLRSITVRHERAGSDLLLIVEDDGAGVPGGEKERIFEKGYGSNTGLGLFIAREVLSITGITIAESGEPGKGARFVMRVPAGSFRYGRKEK